jgi:hypothetical protein
MIISPTSPSKCWTTSAVWISFVTIVFLYFFGLAASSVIPFGPPISIVSVARRVSFSDLLSHDISLAFHGAFLGASIAALLIYTFTHSRRVRLALPLICLLTPLFWTAGGVKGVAQWLLAMPAAPIFTITAVAGSQDGEFYAEGFLVFTAIGWWMLLWCVLLVGALRFSRQETRAA